MQLFCQQDWVALVLHLFGASSFSISTESLVVPTDANLVMWMLPEWPRVVLII